MRCGLKPCQRCNALQLPIANAPPTIGGVSINKRATLQARRRRRHRLQAVRPRQALLLPKAGMQKFQNEQQERPSESDKSPHVRRLSRRADSAQAKGAAAAAFEQTLRRDSGITSEDCC